MSSYEFEVAAKNAVIETCRERYGEEYTIKDIQMVWFCHILGFKKAILINNGPNLQIFEVTYNRDKNEMYVDSYSKNSNDVLFQAEIDMTVHE
jgi:hypothetical protein